MRDLFPHNAVEYFVSYYDYYQPEAYIPSSDTYIEKDAIVNDKVDRMRHSATRSLLARRDVIIVASVSCIYGIGSSEWYQEMLINLEVGQEFRRDRLLRRLVDIQYQRNDIDFHRGTFRVRGDVVEIFPAHSENLAVRIEYWGDEIERIVEIDPHARQRCSKSWISTGSTRQPLRHARRTSKAGDRVDSGGAARVAPEARKRRGNCSKDSGSSSERCTTSRCSSRWASATGSRTTAGTCRAATRASRLRRCSTTFPTTS